jgi:hypothetical protein
LAKAVQQDRDTSKAQSLVTDVYETLYGPGVTPQIRTEFLVRYGCTAWNDTILRTLCDWGDGRGYVEIGAGHGQWARALETHYRHHFKNQKATQSPTTFVRAYDNGSQLPLNPKVYHSKTQPHAAFFGNVRPCPDIGSILAQLEHRQRILLLVYPTDDLAIHTLQAYSAIQQEVATLAGNTSGRGSASSYPPPTLVYVGEGRGGGNAGEDFFDFLEQDGWIVHHIISGVPCGTKGDEKVFIFTKEDRWKSKIQN